jgi:molybdenum cofactor biosynthesis protein B
VAHKSHHHDDVCAVICGIVTVSDTRSEEDDKSGQLIRSLLSERGHSVSFYEIVKDEPDAIAAVVSSAPAEVEVLICNGGTGLARRDTTFEAVSALIEKEITGFGELFRMLSYKQIGAAAMLSRATAGVVAGRILFSVPGSTKAVDLAMTELILPTLGHLVGLVREPEG